MAQRKPYNPNTAYGRRKLREQAHKEYQQLSPDDKFTRNVIGIIVIVVICLLMWGLLGTEGFMKWMQR
jgi:hypothetical protein